jgi:hypothetical protein
MKKAAVELSTLWCDFLWASWWINRIFSLSSYKKKAFIKCMKFDFHVSHGNGPKGQTSSLLSAEDNFCLASASGFLNLKSNAVLYKNANG